jgi:hypothetical protein
MNITNAEIKIAESLGACSDALALAAGSTPDVG